MEKRTSKPSIFISHSHSDWRLAKRLQEVLESVSGRGFAVNRSSEDGAIKSGENWRDWIDDKVLNCDVAIVLLTPGTFRGRWVLWEAGAVAGVQYERRKAAEVPSGDPSTRRVRVLQFSLDHVDLGPFGSTQARSGLNSGHVDSFLSELLDDFQGDLDKKAYNQAIRSMGQTVEDFIKGASADLRFTPIQAAEGIVQDWLARLEVARKKGNDRWIVASKRWINVAFLGAGNADAHSKGEAIDFRIHMRLAEAHMRLGDWSGTIEQLKLAATLSPNDLVMLRSLGGAYREMKNSEQLEQTMDTMRQLDPDIFRKDREGIALRCGYFAGKSDWVAVDKLLGEAEQGLIAEDAYLANWRALADMKVKGAESSKPLFRQLKELLFRTGKGFWDEANLVNALIALGELDEAKTKLQKLELPKKTKEEVTSGTRFYDEIIQTFSLNFDWRVAAGVRD